MKTIAMQKAKMERNIQACRPEQSASHVVRTRRVLQAGTSLIEIMVVLVILLIGVFLAIRVFPAGLATLSSTNNRGRGVRLAQELVGDTTNAAANLPGGVLSAYYDEKTDSNVFRTTYAPDVLQTVPADPASDPYYSDVSPSYNDVNVFNYISNEPVRIPSPVTVNGTAVSEYVVKFGPMYLSAILGVGDPTANPMSDPSLFNSFLSVNSGPLAVTNVSATLSSATSYNEYLTGPQVCLVDYGTLSTPTQLMFQPRAGSSSRTFALSYSYTSSTGVVTTITNESLTVPDGAGYAWIPLAYNGAQIFNMVPGSLMVTRQFDRLPIGSAFTDPYQYQLASANIAGTSANTGVLLFNPAAANLSVPTPTGQTPFMAYVSYFVLDWHIVHDDAEVPNVTPNTVTGLIPVKLSLDAIKRVGDVNPDNTIYSGLYSSNDPNGQNDIDLVNLGAANAAVLGGGSPVLQQGNLIHGVKTPINGNSPDYYIDTDPNSGTYATGTVYVDPTHLPVGSQLRIYYRGDGDWAVAMQKAYTQYTPEVGTASGGSLGVTSTNGTSAIATRPATYDYNTFGIDRTGGGARIYFWLSDLNKSVTLSLQFLVNGQIYRTPPAQYTIDSADGNYAYIDLVSTTGANAGALSASNQAALVADPNWTVYGPIQGVSVKARVIWKDNNNTTNNWRVQDMDTFLTPSGN